MDQSIKYAISGEYTNQLCGGGGGGLTIARNNNAGHDLKNRTKWEANPSLLHQFTILLTFSALLYEDEGKGVKT